LFHLKLIENMKKFTIMLTLLLMAVVATAQTPAKVEDKTPVANCSIDQSGNYVAVSHEAAKVEPTATKQTYTDSKGVVYPVWLNSKGKPFVYRVSRNTGVEYKFYLQVEGQPQPGKPLIQ
jgi:hypothetical protein